MSTRSTPAQWVLILSVALLCPSLVSAQPTQPGQEDPTLALGVNLGQLAAYGLASTTFDDSMLIPLPLEAHLRFSHWWGLASTIQYRRFQDGDLVLDEFSLMAGPRLRLTEQGIEGLYATIKVGIGFAGGQDFAQEDYHRLVFLIQPEVGYALAWGSPGIYLALGVGLQSQIPLLEHPNAIEWCALGKLVNYYIPMLNITVGFGL